MFVDPRVDTGTFTAHGGASASGRLAGTVRCQAGPRPTPVPPESTPEPVALPRREPRPQPFRRLRWHLRRPLRRRHPVRVTRRDHVSIRPTRTPSAAVCDHLHRRRPRLTTAPQSGTGLADRFGAQHPGYLRIHSPNPLLVNVETPLLLDQLRNRPGSAPRSTHRYSPLGPIWTTGHRAAPRGVPPTDGPRSARVRAPGQPGRPGDPSGPATW